MDLHRLGEERSIAMHRRIAEQMRGEPAILERARERVLDWARTGSVGASYAQAWRAALALDIDVLCALLVDPGERARMLRQVSPFAGAIDPRERWSIWRQVGARAVKVP
jgi:hypothetical protein